MKRDKNQYLTKNETRLILKSYYLNRYYYWIKEEKRGIQVTPEIEAEKEVRKLVTNPFSPKSELLHKRTVKRWRRY